eukprot:9482286-Pyramimonas_sp.AAC.1
MLFGNIRRQSWSRRQDIMMGSPSMLCPPTPPWNDQSSHHRCCESVHRFAQMPWQWKHMLRACGLWQ